MVIKSFAVPMIMTVIAEVVFNNSNSDNVMPNAMHAPNKTVANASAHSLLV